MSMSTQTLNGAGALVGAGSKSEGFFKRALQRIIEAQERKAAAYVRQHLAGQSDEHLAKLGYGPVAIKALRKRANGSTIAWL